MADNSTGLPVQTISGQFVQTKLVDSAGSNVAAVDASGRLSVSLTASSATVTVDSELAAAVALTSDAVASPTVPQVAGFAYGYNGATWDRVRVANTGRLQVDVITGAGGTQYVGDAAATATPTGTMGMGLANAAAPAGVSADNDAVAMWMLRNGSPVVNLASSGTLITVGQKAMASSLPVVIASDQATFPVTLATQYVGDAAATATPTGSMTMGLANAAAPSDVSANNDAVSMWMLRNGSPVVNLASSGTLITVGQKAMASSLPVVIASDQSAISVSLAANQSVNLAQVAGTNTVTGGVAGTLAVGGVLAHDAAAAAALPVGIGYFASAAAPADVSADGDAVKAWALRNGSQVVNIAAGGTLLTNIGQAAGSATFVRINDGTTTAGVIVGTTALKVDIASIIGAVPGATNPVPVRLTDGAAFYAAASSAPTLPKFSTKTSSALGAGASVDLTHYVTSGKTGQLAGVDCGATVPLKIIINTELTAAKTTRDVLFTKPYETYQWRSPYKTYITQASADATSGFSVTIKNMDASVAADVYSTAFWDEV